MFSVSIIIPTYNRKRFERLIEYNILCQTYKNIIEVVIGDDSEDDFKLTIPYPITYIKMPRCTIGQKRNILCQHAKGDIIAHMDTDDFYFPTYIEHSVSQMLQNKMFCAGTADMYIFYPSDMIVCKMNNHVLHMANEGTLVFFKKFWEAKNFSELQTSEGLEFLMGRDANIVRTNIDLVMVCVAHQDNTVSKSGWKSLMCNAYPRFLYHNMLYASMTAP